MFIQCDSQQELSGDQTPQVHQQLSIHSRHHSPNAVDNGEQLLSEPQTFGQM